jgi:hypothetical protein
MDSPASKREERLKQGNIVIRREEADELLLRTSANMKIEEIMKLIESNDPRVKRVDLWWRQADRKLLKPLISLIATTTAVRELDLSGNKLRKEGTKMLVKSLATNKSVTSLCLHNNEIGKEGAKSLAGLLKTNNTILSLMIGCNAIGREGVDSLLPVLANPAANLMSLSLASNDLKFKGAESVAKLIQQNRSLTYLDVSSNDLSNSGAKALFLALKSNEKLLFLNVSYNEKGLPIARVGLKAINELLVRNRSQLPPDAFQIKLSPLELASPVSLCSAPNLPTTGGGVGGGPPSPRARDAGPPSPRAGPPSSPRTMSSANWAPQPPTSPRSNSGVQRFPTLSNVLAVLKKDSSSTDLQSSAHMIPPVPQAPPQSSVTLPSKEEPISEASSAEKIEITMTPKTTPTTIAFSSSASGSSITSTSNRRKKEKEPRPPKIRWNEYTQIFGASKSITAPLNDTKRTASIRMADRLTGDQITQLAIANLTNEENENEDSNED